MSLNGHGLGATVDPGTNGALKRPKDGSGLKKDKKDGEKALTAPEVRSLLADMRLKIGEGKTDLEIASQLKLKPGRYNELKKELYRQQTADLYNKTTEDVYLEYKWQQEACIADLNDMINMLGAEDDSKQHNALVGAIKARSEIIDKIVKVGQDMGILEKAPERKIIVGAVAITNMKDVDLRKLITNELHGLASIMNKYGDRDMDGNLISASEVPALPAGPSFTDERRPGIAVAGAGKAAAARASRTTVKRSKVIDVPSGGG